MIIYNSFKHIFGTPISRKAREQEKILAIWSNSIGYGAFKECQKLGLIK